MPTTWLGHAACVLNGKIYVISGYPITNSPRLKTLEEYNPQSDTWAKKTDLPVDNAIFRFGTRVYKNKIYTLGGTAGFNIFPMAEVCNPETDIWEDLPDMNLLVLEWVL